MNKPLRIKLITLGNPEVGKSCIIKRYCEKRFVSKYLMTIGIDYGVTKLSIRDRTIKLNIFDMSGNSCFSEIRNEFYSDTNCVLLVFDVSNKESFRCLDSWYEELSREIGGQAALSQTICILCANKCDKNRVVTELESRNWADKRGFYHMQCSAFDGNGVNELFEAIFTKCLETYENGGKVNPIKESVGYSTEEVAAIEKIISGKNHFEKLGLTYNASREDVKKAYRKLAGMVHPDKCAAPRSEEAFKILVQTKSNLMSKLDVAGSDL